MILARAWRVILLILVSGLKLHSSAADECIIASTSDNTYAYLTRHVFRGDAEHYGKLRSKLPTATVTTSELIVLAHFPRKSTFLGPVVSYLIYYTTNLWKTKNAGGIAII